MKAFLMVTTLVATAIACGGTANNEQNDDGPGGSSGGIVDARGPGGGIVDARGPGGGIADARSPGGSIVDARGGGNGSDAAKDPDGPSGATDAPAADTLVGTGGGATDSLAVADAHGSADAASSDGGGADVPAFTLTSGTRIRARVTTTTISTTDGARYSTAKLVGWFDRELNVPCDLDVASDQVTRCLPTNAVMELFSDPTCSTRIAGMVGSQPPYSEVRFCPVPLNTFHMCPTAEALMVFSLGEALPRPPSSFYAPSLSLNTRVCGTITVAFPPNTVWYKLAATEIPPTRFAAMTTTVTTTTE